MLCFLGTKRYLLAVCMTSVQWVYSGSTYTCNIYKFCVPKCPAWWVLFLITIYTFQSEDRDSVLKPRGYFCIMYAFQVTEPCEHVRTCLWCPKNAVYLYVGKSLLRHNQTNSINFFQCLACYHCIMVFLSQRQQR